MARQKGILKISGTIDGVNFYITKGVGYARKAGGGFNSTAIKTKPSMKRVRENASEFGHCSTLKKHFRLALLPFLKDYKGDRLHARMMTLFTTIKSMDTDSIRGKRRVGIGMQRPSAIRLLKSFNFTTSNVNINTLLQSSTFDWTLQVLSFVDVQFKRIKFPENATHIGLRVGVLDFNFDTLDSKMVLSSTYYIPKGSDMLSFDLQPEDANAITATGITVLDVQFYEEANDVFYPMNGLQVTEFRIIAIHNQQ